MSDTDPIAAIQSRLQAFASKRRSWGELAYLLLQVEESGNWRSAGTFSDWVSSAGKALNLHDSNIWRYLASARYALQLHGITLGSLPEDETVALLNKASPENLELLSKVSRAAPEGLVRDLSIQVLAGTISRAKLREAWQAFRPALNGRTAQGLRSAPRVDMQDPHQQQSVLHSTMLSALTSSGCDWLRNGQTAPCAWFRAVAPKAVPGLLFDAVAAVQDENADIELHVFQIGSSPNSTMELEGLSAYSDYFWFAATCEINAARLPMWVGLIQLKDGQIALLRRAQSRESSLSKTGQLAKALLLRSLKL